MDLRAPGGLFLLSPHRKAVVSSRLAEIAKMTKRDLRSALADSWTQHAGLQCAGLNWQSWSADHESLLDAGACIGGPALAVVFGTLASGYRTWACGMPDLCLYDTRTWTARLIEVKGPRDSLSDIQRAWLHVLVELPGSVGVTVCHVKEP